MADEGHVWRYTRSKSVAAGSGCGLGCTPALSVMTVPLRRHMQQLWQTFFLKQQTATDK